MKDNKISSLKTFQKDVNDSKGDNPNQDKSITNVSHGGNIGTSDEYWKNQVNMLLQEKKSYLILTEQNHIELR